MLTTAKLTRNKGHEVAITALGRLHDGGTPLVYLVCGDGGREEELRDLARAVRLPAVFTGLLEPAEIVTRARGGGRGGASLAQRDLPQRGR